MGEYIRRAGGYAVNILSADQQELSNHFASDEHRQPFTDWPLLPEPASQPLLAGCLAVLGVPTLAGIRRGRSCPAAGRGTGLSSV